jgi:redox-sensitive bicupin YhaK (pirin superfamily)
MLEMVINAREANIGAFAVARVLPFRKRRMVGPFTFLDHGGPLNLTLKLATGSLDVLPHPHIGLSTLSYLFAGATVHRDSTGAEMLIRPGDVGWMTAGSGVSHSERMDEVRRLAGGEFEMLQAWIALPAEHEEVEPSFSFEEGANLPELREGGVHGRLVVGSAFGVSAPIKTYSPAFYIHCDLDAGAVAVLPKEHIERAAYVVRGKIEVAGQYYSPKQLLVFSAGAVPLIKAAEPSTIMLLGGEPIGPRYMWWNFVSSRKERLEQAKADWKAGRIALPFHDGDEFIPLPGAQRPPEPLS